ncbi:unnamed protein product [Ectocarpus fasciculatus]
MISRGKLSSCRLEETTRASLNNRSYRFRSPSPTETRRCPPLWCERDSRFGTSGPSCQTREGRRVWCSLSSAGTARLGKFRWKERRGSIFPSFGVVARASSCGRSCTRPRRGGSCRWSSRPPVRLMPLRRSTSPSPTARIPRRRIYRTARTRTASCAQLLRRSEYLEGRARYRKGRRRLDHGVPSVPCRESRRREEGC